MRHTIVKSHILDVLAKAAPTSVASSFCLTSSILAEAPQDIQNLLSIYCDWSVLSYAVPIVDQSLWIWHRLDDQRYLFANHILERAAAAIQDQLSEDGIGVIDVARRFAGAVSLVELAVRAGLGSRGVNNLLLHQQFGSWLQLHALLINCTMADHQPLTTDVCTKCGLCIKACPAGAISGKHFYPGRCSSLVASPWMPKSKAVALTAHSYIECAECINSCPIGKPPEELFSWKR
ncbi:4Fe-4S double cluster binding domain-containing protein [Rhodopseudomonas palustris]|uniref:4Fe-4S ferredoxin, iron-sulfur binding n=1 Tax=Rhodopseudomonas palustris (strain BisB18) TaxID=316056 RepID=Q218J7_RHOPB